MNRATFSTTFSKASFFVQLADLVCTESRGLGDFRAAAYGYAEAIARLRFSRRLVATEAERLLVEDEIRCVEIKRLRCSEAIFKAAQQKRGLKWMV